MKGEVIECRSRHEYEFLLSSHIIQVESLGDLYPNNQLMQQMITEECDKRSHMDGGMRFNYRLRSEKWMRKF